jgi:hypothetical protein
MDLIQSFRKIGKISGILLLMALAGCHPIQVVQPGTQLLTTRTETIHRPAVRDGDGGWVQLEHDVQVPPGYGVFLPNLDTE